ncbi:MAG: hypothetical protein JXR19_11955 [Bacteroidia bacterium]
MMKTKKTITGGKHSLYAPLSPNYTFNPDQTIQLRDEIIDQMALYCAELSQMLLFDFAENVASGFLSLPVNTGLDTCLYDYKQTIDRKGLYQAGEDILESMRKLIAA